MPPETSVTLEQAMGELLSLVREDGLGVEQAQAVWKRCAAAQEDVLARLETDLGELSEPERNELRKQLEHLLQLNAVARQAVVEERQAITGRLTRAREGGQQLRGYGQGSSTSSGLGESCDMAG
jgi:hypothetical protein